MSFDKLCFEVVVGKLIDFLVLNVKSEKSDNVEIVYFDLKGIDFNGLMFMNKDEEVIVEKVVKDNKENFGSLNVFKDL